MKNYNELALKNGIHKAVDEALADIHVTGLEQRIAAYKKGDLTAGEFLEFLENLNVQGE